MMKKKIYRVLGTNREHNYFDSESFQSQKIVYNGKKPLYTSDNVNDAYNMFRRLSAENYMDHMILIADFGVLSPEQRLKERLDRYDRANSSYDELAPFVEVAEYHRATGLVDMDNEIHIYYKGSEHVFNNALSALKYFELRVNSKDDCRIDLWDMNDEGFLEIRTLVSLKDFRKAKDYKPCGKIEVWDSHMAVPVNFACYS